MSIEARDFPYRSNLVCKFGRPCPAEYAITKQTYCTQLALVRTTCSHICVESVFTSSEVFAQPALEVVELVNMSSTCSSGTQV